MAPDTPEQTPRMQPITGHGLQLHLAQRTRSPSSTSLHEEAARARDVDRRCKASRLEYECQVVV